MDEVTRGRPRRPGMKPVASKLLCGRYRLDRLLGRGGMGQVYQAFDLELGEYVAIKLLLDVALDLASVERLRQEVRLARRVTHRNVARIHDIANHEDTYFFTMQLVEGETLRQILARGPLALAHAIEIAAEICEGLGAAHDAGVLHLDLKPDNVMVAQGGGVVILDFGIAHLAAQPLEQRAGSPAYMAPEQRLGLACDERTDLYALGVTLHELIAGSRPGDRAGALAGCPEPLVGLVASLLAVEPEARPSAARQVADELLAATGARSTGARARRLPTGRRLAVLPFAASSADEEIAAGLTEELIDRLTSLRDARVLAASAAERMRGQDPRVATAQLAVDHVVEGSLRRVGDRVLVTIRLVDSAGLAAWSERFEGTLGDVLRFQDRMARRIAEALRVELGVDSYRGGRSDEAVALYLRSRRKVAGMALWGPDGAVADLDRACAIDPELVPALALRALACVRAWFLGLEDDLDAWRQRATHAVSEARARAGDLPETQLAAAVMALQNGELADAARQLVHTLDLAPTHALAHEYLGRLQCEAGRGEGLTRIAFAHDLDPSLWMGLLDIARHHALHRNWEPYRAALADATNRVRSSAPGIRFLELRVAAWSGDRERVRQIATELAKSRAASALLALYGAVVLGEREPAELADHVAEIDRRRVSRRFAGFAHQLVVEASGLRGDHARALRHLTTASKFGLVDVEWLDLCPALAGSRALPELAEVRREVRTRAAALWLEHKHAP
jgi:eukaryotic-like serine/threonine-protein kinase